MMALLEDILRRLVRLERNQIKPQSARGMRGATGTVGFTFGTVAPRGALMMDGQAVSRTTYKRLFAAIGVVGGPGNGTTTFNVPDARGRVIAHVGGTGILNVLGASRGFETHTLTTAQMPSHSHTPGGTAVGQERFVTTDRTTTFSPRIPGGTWVSGAKTPAYNAGETVGGTAATATTGSGNPHNNVQPTLVANAFIWT